MSNLPFESAPSTGIDKGPFSLGAILRHLDDTHVTMEVLDERTVSFSHVHEGESGVLAFNTNTPCNNRVLDKFGLVLWVSRQAWQQMSQELLAASYPLRHHVESLIDEHVHCQCDQLASKLPLDLSEELEQTDYSVAPDGYSVQRADGAWYWLCESQGDEEDCETSERVYATEAGAIAAAWDDSDEEPPLATPTEHWLVSNELADKLQSLGAPVAKDAWGLNIWGRHDLGELEEDPALQELARLATAST